MPSDKPVAQTASHDARAKVAEPGFYWVRVMGTDRIEWQVAECHHGQNFFVLGDETPFPSTDFRIVSDRLEPPHE